MATAKKSPKKSKRRVPKIPAPKKVTVRIHPIDELENPASGSEEQLFDQHMMQVDALGLKLLALFDDEKVEPIVVMDALQLLLIATVKATLGDAAAGSLKQSLNKFHSELTLTSLLNAITAHGANEPSEQN